jgi:predicted enzyme related to lactoylglutathione lyase
VVWFEVMGQDADKLRDFYEELLGWRFETPSPLGYGMVRPGEGSLPGGVGQVRDGSRGWATFYSRVPQLEMAMARATALGSDVLLEIQELPDVRIAVVTDPEGHPVGLCETRA